MKPKTLMRNLGLLLGVALALPVHAFNITPRAVQITPHSEPRGHLLVQVNQNVVYFLGLNVEPGFVLEPNAVEIFACTDLVYDPVTGEVIDCLHYLNDTDQHNLKVDYSLLSGEGPSATVVKTVKLGKMTLFNPNEGHLVTKHFLPYPAGAISVRIYGSLFGVETDLTIPCSTDPLLHSYSCISYRDSDVGAVFYP